MASVNNQAKHLLVLSEAVFSHCGLMERLSSYKHEPFTVKNKNIFLRCLFS